MDYYIFVYDGKSGAFLDKRLASDEDVTDELLSGHAVEVWRVASDYKGNGFNTDVDGFAFPVSKEE